VSGRAHTRFAERGQYGALTPDSEASPLTGLMLADLSREMLSNWLSVRVPSPQNPNGGVHGDEIWTGFDGSPTGAKRVWETLNRDRVQRRNKHSA